MAQPQVQAAASQAPASVVDKANEYLTFRLGEEEYGIEILKVQEIRKWERPTAVANAPHFIKGVINLRGTIVPIIDMRLNFALDQAEYNQFTVVIILTVGRRVVGAVVDGVSDVVMLPPEDIKPAPDFASGVDTDYITGIAAMGERMLIMLDIEKLMLSPRMALGGSEALPLQ